MAAQIGRRPASWLVGPGLAPVPEVADEVRHGFDRAGALAPTARANIVPPSPCRDRLIRPYSFACITSPLPFSIPETAQGRPADRTHKHCKKSQ